MSANTNEEVGVVYQIGRIFHVDTGIKRFANGTQKSSRAGSYFG